MHQLHMFPNTMGPMTHQPLPFSDNQSAFINPQTRPPASFMPSLCPERRIPDDICHPYFRGTLRDHNWPVSCEPLHTGNPVHYEQGHHHHHPACHMNVYNCCTHVWSSVDHHHSQPKKPRMARDNLLDKTEIRPDTFTQRLMYQIPVSNETAAYNPLSSPPPLIRTIVNQRVSHQRHLKEPVKRKPPKKGTTPDREQFKEHAIMSNVPAVEFSTTSCEISRGGYRSAFMHRIPSQRNANVKEDTETFIGSEKVGTTLRNGNRDGKSISLNDTGKGCKKSNTPDIKKLCSNRELGEKMEQHLPLQHGDECFRIVIGKNTLRECQATALGKEKQSSVTGRNDHDRVYKRRHSLFERVLQEGQSPPQGVLKRSRSLPMTESRDYSQKRYDFHETKTGDHNTEYAVPLFQEYREWKTDASRHLNQHGHLANDEIHPQLQFHPPKNTNRERHESKSFDATTNNSSTSQSSCHKLQSDNFSYKTKMQSHVPCRLVSRNKSVEHGGVDVRSPTISERYQRNDEAKLNSNEEGPAEKSGHFQSVSCGNSSANVRRSSYHDKEQRFQTPVSDQPQATMNMERMPHQQPNVSKRRCNSDSKMPHFQQNQHRSSDNIRRIPKYLDANQMGTSTDCDLSHDQGKKSPNSQTAMAEGVGHIGNVGSSLSPNDCQIRVPISLNELQIRRMVIPRDHIRSDKHVLNDRTAVNEQSCRGQKAVDEPKLLQREVSSATHQPSSHKCYDNKSENHEVEIYISSNDQSLKSVKSQTLKDQTVYEPSPQSQTLPPLPSGKDLDSIDAGCGGYAIDHNALPRIVAVHSIVTNHETLHEKDADLFSLNDKKYWKDLLQKLTCDVSESDNAKSLKIPQANVPEINEVDDPKDIELQLENDPTTKLESVIHPTVHNKDNEWTLWEYLSSPSKDLTIEIKCPTDCDQIDDDTKKRVRRKLTVRELCDKILYTRERIKKEAIPWKKKLLVSLESTFIKRLRKTEKETGEKADNVILKQNEDNNDCKNTGDKKKCNKLRKRKRPVS